MWMDNHTVPGTNPPPQGYSADQEIRRYHRSPLYQVADALKNIEMETLETINPFTIAPWEKRMKVDMHEIPATRTEAGGCMQVAVSSSARNEVVGFVVAIE